MDPRDVPERSSFWFSLKAKDSLGGKLFDQTSILITLILSVFSFVIFWPVISQIDIEEAFFTPLVPAFLFLFELFGVGPTEAMRVLFIVSFIVSTVGIYLFVRDLTKRQMTAVLSTIIYLIPPIPVFILTYFRKGLLVRELEAAKAFLFTVYGDGAHFVALALIPFAAIFFLRYLKSDNRKNLFLSAVFGALIFLATRSQAMSLMLILLTISLSEIFLGMARVKIGRFLLISVSILGLVSFWYTPNFIIESLLLYRVQLISNIGFLFPVSFTLGILMLLFAFVFFARNEKRQPIFIAFLLFVVFLGIVGDWVWHQRSFVPHVQRLIANLNMFFAIVLAVGITAVLDWGQLSERIGVKRRSHAVRSFMAMVLWPLSLFAAGLIIYLVSPLILELFAGQAGVWPKISAQVTGDRQHILKAAGSNFELVRQAGEAWQFLGIAISVITFGVLLISAFGVNDVKKTNLAEGDRAIPIDKEHEEG